MSIVAYLSHSYRPEDRAINIAIWQRLNAAGMVFKVDPPNLDKRPMDVTFLERMMQRSDCFVAIVPDRSSRAASPNGDSDVADAAWSPYQSFECRLALRCNKPRMVILEQSLTLGPLPESERKWTLTFDRSSLAPPAGLDVAVDGLLSWARKRQDEPMPRIGLLRWKQSHPHWGELLGRLRDLFNEDGNENCEILDVDHRTPDHLLVARARALSILVVDMHPAATPAHLVGLLHGAAVPMYRTCLLQDGETALDWSAQLGMALREPSQQALALPAAPALLRGYQVDARMQPVIFWQEPSEAVARNMVQTIQGYQKRERLLEAKNRSREYFLSLRGNRDFISTPGDLVDLSARIKDALDDAGMPAFHYKRSRLEGGVSWKDQLEAQIHDADLLLGLISSTYWDRPECVDELESAVRRWERHQMLIVLYAEGESVGPLPKFLSRAQVNRIDRADANCERVVDDLRARFVDGARKSMETEISRLATLINRHAPLQPEAAMDGWLLRVCGLDDRAVAKLRERLKTVPMEEAATKLVRMLMGAIHEERFGGSALGGLCLTLRSLERDAEVRAWLNGLFSALRLYPNVHNVRDWNARRQRRIVEMGLRSGASAELLRLTSRAVGQVPDPMSFVRQLGAELAEQFEFTPSLQSEPAGRVRLRCSVEDLTVPVEWVVPQGAAEPLGRARPVYRWVEGVVAQAPRDALEACFGHTLGAPPRMLMFGAPTPSLPNLGLELETLRQSLASRYAQWEWPAAPLLQCASEDLQVWVERSDFDIIHLAGHAGFDGETPVFQLASGASGGVEVNGDELASWLRNSAVRFVYLSCCEGAESPLPLERAAGWRRSLCKSLLEAGVAEVLAFFWEVDDAEAVTFTQTFYAKFFPGFDAPAALHAARLNCSLDKAIWASSVLAQRAGSTDVV